MRPYQKSKNERQKIIKSLVDNPAIKAGDHGKIQVDMEAYSQQSKVQKVIKRIANYLLN